MTILLLLVPKSLVLIPFLSWTRHFQGLKNEERKQLSIKVHTNPNALSQLPQSNPATTSHTSNLVATDNIITSSSISGRVKFLDFSSIVTHKSKELKADPDSDECYNLTLGPSFKDESYNKYCTLRYEFKPQSADSAKPGLLSNTEEKSVSVESQNKQIGKSKVTFEGTSEEYKESDAVLFFDGKTLRLELLDRAVEQLRHIQKPGESSTAADGVNHSP
ncbi:uncharacterized protein [Medicago truncatula]|uniref:uncharacterized protein n=1 Tax=Medicago truncatula TaxID=3880 RepID=UPI00196893A7|nr:uncharacterized protein LOC112418678 [Medicago truncatula]